MARVCIIIPAYNEAENIVNVVDGVIRNCPHYDYIIVNDGSSDCTVQKCREKGYKLINLPINLGLSGGFQAGMKYALYKEYDYAIQFDADGQHNTEYISQMLEKAERDNDDIVIGSRFVDKKKPISMRMIGSNLISLCIFLTTFKRIKDPTSGMRLYNRRAICRLANEMNYGPEPDTLAYLMRCDYEISEVQVEMNERMAGESYLNITNSIKYMVHMCSSILLVQWFRKRES